MILEKRKAFLINTAYFGVFILAAVVLLRYIMPMATPFVVGFVIAYVLKRPIRLLSKHLPVPDKLIAILVVLTFYGIVGLLLSLLGIKIISEIAALIAMLPTLYETHGKPLLITVLGNIEDTILALDMALNPGLLAALEEVASRLLQSLGNMISGLSVSTMSFATSIASAVPGLFIELVLMIISTFFIAIDYDHLTGFCQQQMSEKTLQIFLQVKKYIVGTLFVCIRSYILIMTITFAELSIALSIIGIEHGVLIAFVISIFDILPVLGTGGIMIPWSILTLISGNFTLGIALLLVYLIITVIRNIIEPKIVGGQLGLHPVVTLCSMYVGVQLLGIAGLFGFPIGLSLLRYLNDNGVIKVFR